MAITHRATGTEVFGTNSITPGIPAGATTGDMMLLLAGGKPYNAGVSSGWNSLGSFTDGTVGAGVDVGSMKVEAWWKEHDGSEADPTVTEGSPTWNIFGAIITVFQKAGDDTWQTPTIAGGGDSDTSSNEFGVTTGGTLTFAAGDWAITFAAFRSDAATPCSVHLGTPVVSGVTFNLGTHDPATDPETTSGGDMGMCCTRGSVQSGSGTGTAQILATLAAAHSGAALAIRLGVTAAAALVPRTTTYPQLLAH